MIYKQLYTLKQGDELMKKIKTQDCPFCGKEPYHHQTKLMTLRYKSNPITMKQPGYWCDACGEGVIGGEDRKTTQKELQTFRAEIDTAGQLF